MANLVICCDGTWNTPDQRHNGLPAPSNIAKIFSAIDEKDATEIPQKKFYRKGVGTTGGWFSRLRGGSMAAGIDDDIISAYKALADRYNETDKIFLFGFSRGAFAARSLSGLVQKCGIPDFQNLPSEDPERWRITKDAFAIYRDEQASPDAMTWDRHEEIKMHFLGVFDTVGALGVPDEVWWLKPFDTSTNYRFHNISLSKSVYVARHAIAIDERRSTFPPTLWNGIENNINAQQVWFSGVHADIGGGYSESGLSDVTLKWMINEAEKCGLKLNPGFTSQIKPDHNGTLNESVTSIFRKLRVLPRSVPYFETKSGQMWVSEHARNRVSKPPLKQPNYWKHSPLEAGVPTTLNIHSRRRWHPTGLFLNAHTSYSFSATGEWIDGSAKCGPKGRGTSAQHFGAHRAIFFELCEWMETRLQRIWKHTDLRFTRRHREIGWFSLTGVVANGTLPDNKDDKALSHEVFEIGTGAKFTPKRDGWFYCYPNDAWHSYQNNKGSVMLTVTKH